MPKIIITLVLVLTFMQSSAARIKEADANAYAENVGFSLGADIALLVTKKSYRVHAYIGGETTGDPIKVSAWGQGEYITKGSAVVLKALISELQAMGYKPRLVNQPSLIKSGEYVVVPNIVIRMATLRGRVAKWDGTKSLIKEKGRGMGGLIWSGSGQAVSVFINAYNPEGKWLFKSYGGVALPSYVDLRSGKDLIKDEIYDNENLLIKGIKQVVLPFKKIAIKEPNSYQAAEFTTTVKNPLRFKMQKCKYKEYLTQPNHKAFFVFTDPTGEFVMGYSVAKKSVKEAVSEAKSNCEMEGASCQLFDLDGELIVSVPDLNLDIPCAFETQ